VHLSRAFLAGFINIGERTTGTSIGIFGSSKKSKYIREKIKQDI
jgi:hypothetical protein